MLTLNEERFSAVDDLFAGYGGLSIRRVSVIRQILSFQQRYNNTEPEDEWFSKRIKALPHSKFATVQDPAFAVEDIYKEKPYGFVIRDTAMIKSSVWDNNTERTAILNYCPEIKMILHMKLMREQCPGELS